MIWVSSHPHAGTDTLFFADFADNSKFHLIPMRGRIRIILPFVVYYLYVSSHPHAGTDTHSDDLRYQR